MRSTKGESMPVSDRHFDDVRAYFIKSMGGVCQQCGTLFSLEFHHPAPLNTKMGRGRDCRMWDWFEAANHDNLKLLCHACHVELHKAERDERRRLLKEAKQAAKEARK